LSKTLGNTHYVQNNNMGPFSNRKVQLQEKRAEDDFKFVQFQNQ